jgi:hypothetical protein
MVGGLIAWLRGDGHGLRPAGSRGGLVWAWIGLYAVGGSGSGLVFERAHAEASSQALPEPPGVQQAGSEVDPAADPAENFQPSPWDASVSLRTWSGYRDNPQLSSVNPVGSGFVAGGGEFMVFRLPVDGWEATCFGLLEHLSYWTAGLAPETTGVVDARVKRRWGDGWSWAAGLEYFYLKQVFDASELVGVRVIIPTEGHTLGFRPQLGKEMGPYWRWEMEPELSRQWLAEPLDGFLDTGVKLQALRKLGSKSGSEWGISYRFRDRGFDERSPRDESGELLEGTLHYRQHEVESVWRSVWGERRRWRTQLRGGYLGSNDNEGGYFDYDRFQLAAQVRYTSEHWEIRAEVKARWYMYAAQRAYEPDGPERRRSDWTFLLRGDWKISRRWRAFVQYDDEMLDENMAAADYRAVGVSGGVEWEL